MVKDTVQSEELFPSPLQSLAQDNAARSPGRHLGDVETPEVQVKTISEGAGSGEGRKRVVK